MSQSVTREGWRTHRAASVCATCGCTVGARIFIFPVRNEVSQTPSIVQW